MNPDPNGAEPGFSALTSLRRFVRKRPARERCELCEAALADEHAHLVEPESRRLICACDACAILFSNQGTTRYRRVPRRSRLLIGFHLSDESWQSLQLPINLAFFLNSTPSGGVVSLYPGPAGVTEAPADADAWQALVQQNPILNEFEPDVEALLVNRINQARDYYRVGVDECYKLSGLIRTTWRGLSGGAAAWEAIDGFFVDLKRRSS